MTRNRYHSGKKVRKYRRTVLITALLIVVVSLISFAAVNFINFKNNEGPDQKEYHRLWASGAFEKILTLSGEQLAQKPLDYFLLTINGFSAYQLAIAQINNFSMLSYIDNCIWSLRKALILKESLKDGRLFYVLGKAYYYKGNGYADLAIKYLEKALESGYVERDIPEYLGLAYISVKDYRSGVASFTQALNPADGINALPSDTLLLSIAGAYIAMGEDDSAFAYLMRCMEVSKDSGMILSARLSLGDIFLRKGNYGGAEEQYTLVIRESGENAEAHYRLGELYSSRGETIRARAEWRRAVQIDPAHRQARSRLNI